MMTPSCIQITSNCIHRSCVYSLIKIYSDELDNKVKYLKFNYLINPTYP